MKRIIIGITGATGTIYGWRLMEMLRNEGDTEIHLVMSQSAKLTLKMEHDVSIDYFNSLAHEVHQPGNIGASISSGSFHSAGMIIAPCSIKTMSNIAMGNTGDLISRAADVILKERRKSSIKAVCAYSISWTYMLKALHVGARRVVCQQLGKVSKAARPSQEFRAKESLKI